LLNETTGAFGGGSNPRYEPDMQPTAPHRPFMLSCRLLLNSTKYCIPVKLKIKMDMSRWCGTCSNSFRIKHI